MYRITYEQGNGYSCGCCSSSYTEQEDLQTKEEVLQWLIDYKADASDRELESIEKEIGVDIQDQFVVPPEKVDELVSLRKTQKENREAKAKEDRKIKAEASEKATLKRLAAKYPEILEEA